MLVTRRVNALFHRRTVPTLFANLEGSAPMNELRFVRRDERSLILANESDEEFRLVIDDLLITELKHASRKEREGTVKVRPREIQSLVRAGKSRAEIATITGLDEASIERYEEPVLAERRYILERAHAVEVRTEGSETADQRFGGVIAERLLALEADASEWAAWRDEEAGWLISLEFISRDVAHRALWSFDHRKQTLAPTNSDAVSLSKQGDVGDRLIPKLRAVDNGDRTSQFAAVAEPAAQTKPAPAAPVAPEPIVPVAPVVAVAPQAGPDANGPAPAVSAPANPAVSSPAAPPLDANAEYVRRREIDQRAIKSEDSGPADFSQTADLLDALRRRRGERQLAESQDPDDTETTPLATQPPAMPTQLPGMSQLPEAAPAQTSESDAPARNVKKPRSIWGGAGVASGVTVASQRETGSGAPKPPSLVSAPQVSAPAAPPAQPGADAATPAADAATEADSEAAVDPRAPRKGRASIPSWDDILFGTRSDEDPAG